MCIVFAAMAPKNLGFPSPCLCDIDCKPPGLLASVNQSVELGN